jgi:hypothetical protein
LPSTKTLEESFWSKVEKGESCWLWRGARGITGGGTLSLIHGWGGTTWTAQRRAYTLAVGEIPSGAKVWRACENAECVRPEHLVLSEEGRSWRKSIANRERAKLVFKHDDAKRLVWRMRREAEGFFKKRARYVSSKGKGVVSGRALMELWRRQGGRCALTGRRLTRENAQVDHIVAVSKGGRTEPENLQWLCREMNSFKREMSEDELIALCQEIMQHRYSVVLPNRLNTLEMEPTVSVSASVN